jgi:pilus assembly protein CpaE
MPADGMYGRSIGMQTSASSGAANSWRPLIVCPHAALSSRIRSTLRELRIDDVGYVSEYPQAGTISGVLEHHGRNICLIDVASNAEQALALIAEAAPSVPVVALNPQNDADLILRCLRRGASEFLADPTVGQAGEILDRLARLRIAAEPPKSGTVYCLLPGKAGCGASTLAAYLALDIKRGGVPKVLLVDTDTVTGSISFLLRIKSDFHLGDAVRDCTRMDDDLWARLAVPCHGVDVLPAPENPATPIVIDRQIALELLSFWRKHYDVIVLDAPGTHPTGFEFAAIADEVLLVTTNELAALHAARRSVECLEHNAVDRNRLKLIVTRYTPATGLKREDVRTALKLEPYALLQNDYSAVQDAILDGKAVSSTSNFGRSIHALGERLMGKVPPVRKHSPIWNLFAAKT